jgi:hypothetical protein
VQALVVEGSGMQQSVWAAVPGSRPTTCSARAAEKSMGSGGEKGSSGINLNGVQIGMYAVRALVYLNTVKMKIGNTHPEQADHRPQQWIGIAISIIRALFI